MATGGLIDGVLEDLPNRCTFSRWEQLVMGFSHMKENHVRHT